MSKVVKISEKGVIDMHKARHFIAVTLVFSMMFSSLFPLQGLGCSNNEKCKSKQIRMNGPQLGIGETITVLERKIEHGSDDAEENPSTGTMEIDSTDLEMGYYKDIRGQQLVGLNFHDISIPKDAVITNAFIQFATDENSSGSITLNIRAQAVDNSSTFSSTKYNISQRQTTNAYVNWSPAKWSIIGESGLNQRTPDMKNIIQEVINRTGWVSGNSLALIIKGSGSYKRVAEAIEGSSTKMPLLHIEYTTSTQTIPVTGVTLNKSATTISVGSSELLTAAVLPTNATNKTVSFASSNTAVATVDNTGKVTGIAAGTATITVTTADGGFKASCSVTVNSITIPVTGVTLNKASTTISVGSSEILTATVLPSNATNKAVSFASSNTAVATVDNTGKVTGKSAGTAVITVTTADGGFKASCSVTVSSTTTIPVTGVTLNKTSLGLLAGGSETLAATVLPTNATNKAVSFKSSNTSIATVDNTGKVTGIAKGNATITVTTADGGKTAACMVYIASSSAVYYKGKVYPSEKKEFISAEGARIAQLTTCTADETAPYMTNNGYIPDENGLVFASKRTGSWNIFYMNLDTGEYKQLTSYIGSGIGIAVSPIAKKVYYMTGGVLSSVDIKTLEEKVIYTFDNTQFDYSHVSITKDGAYAAISITQKTSGLDSEQRFLANPLSIVLTGKTDGTGWHEAFREQKWIAHAMISPTDSNKILFCHEGPWNMVEQRMWVVNSDGTGLKPVRVEEFPSIQIGHEYWKEDGIHVGYQCWYSGQQSRMGIANAIDGTYVEYFTPEGNQHTQSNPETTLFVGDGKATAPYITLYKLESGKMISLGKLYNHGCQFDTQPVHPHPVFTPDSKAIIFNSPNDGNWNVYMAYINTQTIPVTGVTLNKASTTISAGTSETLIATVQPSNATNKAVTFASSNTAIATVDNNGKVTGIAAGTAAITVTTADGGFKASCSVTVNNTTIPVTGITLNKAATTLNVGSSETLIATVQPSNATNKTVSFISSNTAAATVDSTGKVTGIALGTAIITAKTADGGFTASCTVTVISAPPPPSAYNVYYGHLHNHSTIQEGLMTPAQAYTYARDTAKLDFFGLAEHSYDMDATKWTATKTAADTYNQDGTFVTFHGFEWSSGATYGHVAVINSPDYAKCSGMTTTFEQLVTWLSAREGIAFCNHPGREDDKGLEFQHFTTTPNDKVVGMELWNKSYPFTTYYYNDGYTIGDGKGHFDEANSRGWKIGASGSLDNHSSTIGGEYRLAVLATEKTRAAIYDALKNRRFYSTIDRNIRMSFEMDGAQMGSVIGSGTHNAVIKVTDDNNEAFTKIMIFKNGTAAYTFTPNSTAPVINQSITTNAGDYYYIKVTQADGGEAISSPIFIENGTTIPVTGITLNKTAATISVGSSETLTATVLPSNATNKSVTFASSNTAVATVDSTGKVTGLAAGTAAITVKTADGGFTASCTVTVSSAPPPSAYNVYYGCLHNHSTLSSGLLTPEAEYDYAKNTSKFDFLGITDHDDDLATAANYQLLVNAANSKNQDGTFVTFAGFEWSTGNGHVSVVNTPDYTSYKNSVTNTFEELMTWLSAREGVAFCNHPGRQDSYGAEFQHFTTTPTDKLVGMELWNRSEGFSSYYYNDGYYTNDGNKSYFDEANSRGWKVGAEGSLDNHGSTLGGEFRMAILATEKTRAALYDALKNRRFYSTLDRNIRMSFEMDGAQMGSVIGSGNHNAVIKVTDDNNETFTKIIIFKNGTAAFTFTPSSTAPVINQSLTTNAGDYYYIKVTQSDGNEAISSPIYIR